METKTTFEIETSSDGVAWRHFCNHSGAISKTPEGTQAWARSIVPDRFLMRLVKVETVVTRTVVSQPGEMG